MYFPETGHPANGMVMSTVSDAADFAKASLYLDCEGRLGVSHHNNGVTDVLSCRRHHTKDLLMLMQVRVYFPETGHPAYGILRSIVKDSTDTANTSSYLDSDGRVGASYNNNVEADPRWDHHYLADELWHMVTLTTLSSNATGPQGFAMFLDGLLVGLQSADEIYSGKWEHC